MQKTGVCSRRIQRVGNAYQVHGGWWELKVLTLTNQDTPTKTIQALTFNELSYSVVINTRTQSTKEVNGLPREGVHKVLDLAAVEVVVLEDSKAHTNTIFTSWVPVVLLHASITDERSIQCAEIITCNNGL